MRIYGNYFKKKNFFWISGFTWVDFLSMRLSIRMVLSFEVQYVSKASVGFNMYVNNEWRYYLLWNNTHKKKKCIFFLFLFSACYTFIVDTLNNRSSWKKKKTFFFLSTLEVDYFSPINNEWIFRRWKICLINKYFCSFIIIFNSKKNKRKKNNQFGSK